MNTQSKKSLKWNSYVAAGFLCLAFVMGCNNNKGANEATPSTTGSSGIQNVPSNGTKKADVKDDVKSALKSASLGDIDVSQDRDKGVLTLNGTLSSDDAKQSAEDLAKKNAPGYVIANQILVASGGDRSQAKKIASKTDDAIEDNFKAAIKQHANLDSQSIHADVKNGVVKLKGSVKTAAQKHEAGVLAKGIANVNSVVNQLEVKPGKDSSSN